MMTFIILSGFLTVLIFVFHPFRKSSLWEFIENLIVLIFSCCSIWFCGLVSAFMRNFWGEISLIYKKIYIHQFLFLFSYLAAMRPSSIRHRQTSRGCLWRTSGGACAAYRQRGHGDSKEEKVTYLKGEMFPEINYLCQKETGTAAREGTFQGAICLYCVSLSLKPSGNSCGLRMCSWGHKGIKASLKSQPLI